MEKVTKIVLTGGPCAGKTTALAKIEQFLTERGIKVFIVSESATELIRGGIRPFGESSFSMVTFQKFILNYQLEKEKIYDMVAQEWNKPCVIIYDRGLLDNKAYITDEEFTSLLKQYGYQELDFLDRYDMVIHLVSAADGAEEYYTLANNESRSEGVEEARILDQKTLNAWMGHHNLVVVDNRTNFEEKMDQVLENIKNLIHYPYSVKYQKKYLVDLEHSTLDFLKAKKVQKMEFVQTYTEENHMEKRLRKRTMNGESTYYLTMKRREKGMNLIVTDKRISESLYLSLLSSWENKKEITKTRWTFNEQHQYFCLDFFPNGEAILEVNPMNQKNQVCLPQSLVVQEVTDREEYSNYVMACQKSEQVLCLQRKR